MHIEPSNLAVIDLGSNTFHLLIVGLDGSTIYKERVYVSLAEEGIEHIGKQAYQRGIDTLSNFIKLLDQYHVEKVKIFGTAALRSADNATQFINEIYDKTNRKIEVISGLEEARLIYKGISSVVSMESGSYLIMDIGGGSVEFIIVRDGTMEEARSFNIGIGQLYSKLSHSHPITPSEKTQIKTYISDALSSLKELFESYQFSALVGASGSFEVLEAMNNLEVTPNQYNEVNLETFREKATWLFNADYEALSMHEAIPPSRAKLIVLAFLLIDVVLELTEINNIYISPVAMKEGILLEMRHGS